MKERGGETKSCSFKLAGNETCVVHAFKTGFPQNPKRSEGFEGKRRGCETTKLFCKAENEVSEAFVLKTGFPRNPKRSEDFEGKRRGDEVVQFQACLKRNMRSPCLKTGFPQNSKRSESFEGKRRGCETTKLFCKAENEVSEAITDDLPPWLSG
ncbi:hypothetical protein KAI58_02345 [Candidatus Gracilibacteria bacterium]|nr:hypothetical protein [Candidatus Gracilibacteria bacterium]